MRDGVRIMPDGSAAANQLGLTNAIPARISFVTDGHSRALKIDGRAVRFRHAGPSVMQWTGKPAALVVQALRWLGRGTATDARVVSTLNRNLPAHVKMDLWHHRRDLPGWIRQLVRSLTNDWLPLPMGSPEPSAVGTFCSRLCAGRHLAVPVGRSGAQTEVGLLGESQEQQVVDRLAVQRDAERIANDSGGSPRPCILQFDSALIQVVAHVILPFIRSSIS